ncbi:hypothetical protein ACN38_g7427 [Penicillium nordicum]|uniref:Uncharacterized protein n=1 Tax=Penicillium nordicum TaxID=229535 RepID=A0A0M9WED6_9EURO|nr:hypothetical protein ACN38_g7427 [Penicillium nordicum]
MELVIYSPLSLQRSCTSPQKVTWVNDTHQKVVLPRSGVTDIMRGKFKVNYHLPRRYTAHTEPSPIDLPNCYNNQASPTYSLNRHPFSQGTKTPQFPPSTPYSSYGSQCRTISVLLPKFGLCATFSNSGPRYFHSNS